MNGACIMAAGAIAAAAALGCASSSGPPAQRPDRVIAVTESEVIRSTEMANPDKVQVKAKPDSVFALLKSIYPEVGVEVKLLDPAKGEIGNRNFSKYYNLKGTPLHNYVGCGTNATGPSADTYRVTMSIVSYVAPSGTGSVVSTHLDAKADDSGSSKGMLSCLSTGMLEGRVNQLLLSRSGG